MDLHQMWLISIRGEMLDCNRLTSKKKVAMRHLPFGNLIQ